MKNYCIAFFLILFLGSCQKKMALFMPSNNIEFESEPNLQKHVGPNVKIKNLNLNVILDSVQNVENQNIAFEKQTEISIQKTEKIHKKSLPIRVSKSSKVFEKEEKKKKKKRNRNPIFNDGVKIGIVFLIIAIGLALVPLSQLSILFGIVSAVFFVLGLKKYMRKNRFRNIFKR
jgi:hypothetical protein